MQTTTPQKPRFEDGFEVEPSDIPEEIEAQYVGEWIAWDVDAKSVIAHAVDLNDMLPVTRKAHAAGRHLYIHHALPPDAVIVGGF